MVNIHGSGREERQTYFTSGRETPRRNKHERSFSGRAGVCLDTQMEVLEGTSHSSLTKDDKIRGYEVWDVARTELLWVSCPFLWCFNRLSLVQQGVLLSQHQPTRVSFQWPISTKDILHVYICVHLCDFRKDFTARDWMSSSLIFCKFRMLFVPRCGSGPPSFSWHCSLLTFYAPLLTYWGLIEKMRKS